MATALKAIERSRSNKASMTKIREKGLFPAVVYGKNKQNSTIAVEEIEFTKVLKDAGRNGIIQLNVGQQKEDVMLQDVQTDPLKGEIIHADFYIVDMQSEVTVEVNVHLVGEAKGVKDGGILQQPLHQVSIKALPGEIPETIDVDITHMDIGENISIADLKGKGKYKVLDDEATVIASILPPATEEVVESGEVQDGQDVEEAKAEAEEEQEDNAAER